MASASVGVCVRFEPQDYQAIQALAGKGNVGPFIRMATMNAAKQIQTTLVGTNTHANH